jgi:hypothetical protein
MLPQIRLSITGPHPIICFLLPWPDGRWRKILPLDKKLHETGVWEVSKKIHYLLNPCKIRRNCGPVTGVFWLASPLLKGHECQFTT